MVYGPARENGIGYENLEDGALRIHFPAANRRLRAVAPAVAAVIFLSASAVLLLTPAAFPLRIATICFALAALSIGSVFSYIALYLLLVSTAATARPGALTVERSIGMFRSQKTYRTPDLVEFACGIEGEQKLTKQKRAFSNETETNLTVFYGIYIVPLSASKFWLTGGMKDLHAAQEITDALRKRIGFIHSPTSPAKA